MRRRNMYYATGMPGWMRFGYSPGWVDRSASGLGPCAEFMMTGQWPNPAMAAAWQAMAGGQAPAWPGMQGPWGAPVDRAQQLAALQSQLEMLTAQVQAIHEQIASLEDND